MLENMRDLKEKLNYILNFIDDKDNVVFLDYPLHHNVGDMLIFLGTNEFFKKNNIKIRNFYSVYDYNFDSLRKSIDDKTTILFHGGGNFGDLYKIHQDFREYVVKEFPNNKIIILPQTAFFESEDNLKKSINIFKYHKNIIMFARDSKTFDLFQMFSNQVYLMPDMAHYLYGKFKKKKQKQDILYFLRQDIEKVELQDSFKALKSYDWLNFLSSIDRNSINFIIKFAKLNKILKIRILEKVYFSIWLHQVEEIGDKLAFEFSGYDVIVTSRLHGHILSCLVDVNSKIIDNSYGKNKTYYEEWTKNLGISSLLN